MRRSRNSCRACRSRPRRDVAAPGARRAFCLESESRRGTQMKSLALILLGVICGMRAAQAQTYPARPITVTVTAAAGGVTDVVARAIAQRMAADWGQQVIIENKGGGAHAVGAQ